jgi:hypothetical protein
LVFLVAAAVLSPVYISTAQDTSRLCLTRSLAEGRLTIDPCVGDNIDQARYHGRVYSDKAPGMSALALPAALAVRLPSADKWHHTGDLRGWAVRVLTSGVAFVVLLLMVGRVAEGVAPGSGGLAVVAFGLGTLAAPLAATTFGHVTAAALAFGAFLLGTRGRSATAGLAAGAAVVVEYQAALALAILAAYVALRGLRPLARYAVGGALPILVLAAYDWRAFGSPLHLSYRYVTNRFAAEQGSGLFGIRLPNIHGAYWVFAGDRGLLVTSPVLVAAAVGLLLLWRSYRAEVLVCALIALVFVAVNCGYFLPYGGTSPGPRFLVPALPFAAVGLGPAFARWPRATASLAAVSALGTLAITLTWARALDTAYRQTVWGEVGRLAIDGVDAQLVQQLTKTLASWAGLQRGVGAGVVLALAAVGFVIALRDGRGCLGVVRLGAR